MDDPTTISEQTTRARILLVDDDEAVTRTLSRILRGGQYEVTVANNGRTALERLEASGWELVLLDLVNDIDWRAVLRAATRKPFPPVVLMISGASDLRTAVEAMREGASDFLEKPIGSSELLDRIERSLTQAAKRFAVPNGGPRRRMPSVFAPDALGPAMRDALALADRLAATPSLPALIIGESGVGKQVLAERIHDRSARRQRPFLCVNLAAIPENMIEAELFGSVRGAFTDAKRDRAGYLATADGGTILLDEIGEFRTEYQAKLLRVLEERSFFPVGSDRERSVDLRILAATNKDPDEMVKNGSLRLDLFYRLGLVVRVPPLRERTGEIEPLAKSFVETLCKEFGLPTCSLAPDGLDALRQYPWPGNIRELRNVLERAVMVLDGDVLHARHLGLERDVTGPQPSEDDSEAPASLRLEDTRRRRFDHVEREHIERVLRIAGGSRSRAADLLGISRSTLYEKLKRYNLERSG